MRFRAAAFVVLATALSLSGCKSKPEKGAQSFHAVPLCAPFDAWQPPTEGGVVWFCDGKSLHVVYDSTDKKALGEKYQAAITKHGWVLRNGKIDISPRQWLGLYDKDKKALTIAVVDADFSGKVPGGVQVSLGLADMP